uniref:hypothetical protein n=1 Tax=Nemalion vermiculare TaxID=935621 RepID=UPI00257E10A3|nr:hypothetical protein QU266_pgp120 [Nemalion vermiculare]WGV34305.1 hypothetical protein [Nemalion vermiculare]
MTTNNLYCVLLLFTCTLFKLSFPSLHKHQQHFAFISSNSSVYPVESNKRKLISQEIVIYGIKNRTLKKNLASLLDIDFNSVNIIETQQIRRWVFQLKICGFFSQVNFHISTYQCHQVIHIYLSVNPLLRTISVIDRENKLVPCSYIKSLFRYQIGKPINFLKVNQATHLLRLWYHDRGYNLAGIRINQDFLETTNLVIEISEGIVERIDVVLSANSANQKFLHLEDIKVFLSLLRQTPGHAFNSKNFEVGVINLKTKKFISQIDYEILPDIMKPANVNLTIYLKGLGKKSIHFSSKKVYVTSKISEPVERLLSNLAQYYDTYSILIQLARFTLISVVQLSSQLNTMIYPSIPSTYYYVYPNLSSHSVSCMRDELFYKSHLTQLLFISKDNFSFRYKLNGLNTSIGKILVDARFRITESNLSIKYEVPFTSLLNYTFSNVLFSIDTSKYFGNSQNQNTRYSCASTISAQDQNSLTSYYNAYLNISNFLGSFLSDRLDFKVKRQLRKSVHFQYYPKFINNFDQSNNSRTHLIYSHSSARWLNQVSLFSNLKMSINYKKSREDETDHLFEILRVMPNHYTSSEVSDYYSAITYKSKTNITLQNRRIGLSLKFMNLIKNYRGLPSLHKSFQYNKRSSDSSLKRLLFCSPKCINVRLDYCLPINKNTDLDIFLDWSYDQKACRSDVTRYFALSSFGNNPKTQLGLSYGFGIQFVTPIKQVPPLTIEYVYNIDNTQYLKLIIET